MRPRKLAPAVPSILYLGAALLAPSLASGDAAVPQPAAAASREASSQQQEQEAQSKKKASPAEAGTHSWDSPAYETRVTGPRPVHEDQLIGSYLQPRWTARRRFPTTRVYVIPAATVQLEFWLEGKFDLDGVEPTRWRPQYEIEFGLGHRLQLDIYLGTQQVGADGPMELYQEKIELRYALADWGVIPANPTLYLEFINQHNGSPKLEFKVLLGGSLAPRWHWGANLAFEGELMGDELEFEYAVTLAVSRTIEPRRFSLGLEARGEMADRDGERFAFQNYEILAGPSLQWCPVDPLHIDLVALFGGEVEHEDGRRKTVYIAQPLLVVGWEF